MARSAGEVKADIALTRQVIERDLDALHRHVPKRSWLSYSCLAGGLGVGLLLSQVPLLVMVSRGIQVVQLGATIMAMVGTVERLLAGARSGRGEWPPVRGDREAMQRNGITQGSTAMIHTGGGQR